MEERKIVDLAGLKQVSSEMRTSSTELLTFFNSDIVRELQKCSSELVVSGLNTYEVMISFRTMFTSLSNNLLSLANVIDKTIVPEYELSASKVSRMFDSDFASQMKDYMKIINSIK